MFFWMMAKKLMVIDLQIPRTNQGLQVILTNQYINRDGNGMSYTIVFKKAFKKIQRNLMG